MFREIGLELSVRESAVIGIFDLDNVSWSKQSRAFLSRAEAAGEVVEATDSLPKAFILTQEYGMPYTPKLDPPPKSVPAMSLPVRGAITASLSSSVP